MDTTTTADSGDVGHQLIDALRSAWRTVQPSEPCDAWLHSAAAALTEITDTSDAAKADPDAAPIRGADAARSERALLAAALAEIRPAQAETVRLDAAAAATRARLSSLKRRVRHRAIQQLSESPQLREPLSAALADWDLPAIGEDPDDDRY